jgi:hypothetical protein
VRQGSLRTRSIIFPPCAPQPHTALDRGRRRHPGPLTHRRSGLLPRCRSASSPSSLRWGPSRSTRRSFLYRLRTHRARQLHPRPRRCCADLRPALTDRFRAAHLDTRSPRATAVSGRAAAIIRRAGRVTTTGRVMATSIPSAGSPASDLAPVASIASAGSTMAGSVPAAASTPVAGSTVRQRPTAQLGLAASAPRRDIWVASAGGREPFGGLKADWLSAVKLQAALWIDRLSYPARHSWALPQQTCPSPR